MAAFAQGHIWAAVARWEPEEGEELCKPSEGNPQPFHKGAG